MKLITRETGIGPNAFSECVFPNQRVWDNAPERAREAMLESIVTGGFDSDCIRRKVGNWEGQVMAIRAGLVDGLPYKWRGADEPWIDVWRINDAGRSALREAGKAVPILLPARDDWHSTPQRVNAFEYCAYELTRDDLPALRLFKEPVPCGANWGMEPLLRIEDVVALRDYLNDWLSRAEAAKHAKELGQ